MNHIICLYFRFLYQRTVQPRAVRAAEIFEEPGFSVSNQGKVTPGDSFVRKMDEVVLQRPHSDLAVFIGQRKLDRSPVNVCNKRKHCIHLIIFAPGGNKVAKSW